MIRVTSPNALVMWAALFGLFLPTSLGGTISLPLGRAAIVLNAVLLGALLFRTGPLDRLQAGIAASIVAWMTVLTLFTPQAEFASGVLFVFLGLSCLLALRLDRVAAPGPWLLTLINLFVLIVGVGLSLNVGVVNAFIKTFYAAFYQALLVSMIDWYHKPVLTLATHSTAGFFYYLFFWLNFRTFRSTGSRAALCWTLVVVALGINVRSTTSAVLMTVACVQMAVYFAVRIPRRLRGPAVFASLPAAALVMLLAGVPARLAAVAEVLEGTQTAGLRSRYSTTGMLAGNLRYLNESPFRPIGFNYGPEDLFYGDSGFVLVMVRGSLPLLLLIYVGFGRFIYGNLKSRLDARCLFLVTCAFEVGYVPLQTFRFTAFLPFIIVWLNQLPPEPARVKPVAREGDSGADRGDEARP